MEIKENEYRNGKSSSNIINNKHKRKHIDINDGKSESASQPPTICQMYE